MQHMQLVRFLSFCFSVWIGLVECMPALMVHARRCRHCACTVRTYVVFILARTKDHAHESLTSQGLSSFRLLQFVANSAKQVVLESRFPEVKDPGEKLAKSFKEDKVDNAAKDWSAETCKRYISISAALDHADIKQAMLLYEGVFRRSGHLDSISMLRAVTQVCATTAEIVYVIHTLFMEQVVGIRSAMPVMGKRVQGNCFQLGALIANTD